MLAFEGDMNMYKMSWTPWYQVGDGSFMRVGSGFGEGRSLLDRVLGRPGYLMFGSSIEQKKKLKPGTPYRLRDGTEMIA